MKKEMMQMKVRKDAHRTLKMLSTASGLSLQEYLDKAISNSIKYELIMWPKNKPRPSMTSDNAYERILASALISFTTIE